MKKRRIVLLALVVMSVLVVGRVLASPSADYEISWWTVDGGGRMSTGGDCALSGTIGQPDAGLLSGEGYALLGGFWGGAAVEYRVYLPVVLRNY